MPDSSPYLSLVVASRNDDHGGNLLGRMQAFVDGLIGQCRRHRLDAELIVIEWNPPSDRPRLAEAVRWPVDTHPCPVRIIEVPAEHHRRFANAERLPLFQMIAKNVGIRRARGRFILATNIDILFSNELMAFLAARRLEPGRMYRIDRHDVRPDVIAAGNLDEQLARCRQSLVRVNRRDGAFPLTPDGQLTLFPEDIVAAEDGLMLGSGWYPVECQNGTVFRWAGQRAEIICSPLPLYSGGEGLGVRGMGSLPAAARPLTPDPSPLSTGERGVDDRLLSLTLDLEPGPAVRYQPFDLEVCDESGRTVARGSVAGRCQVTCALPQGGRYFLDVLHGSGPTPNDPRTLNFRVFRCQQSQSLRALLSPSPPTPLPQGARGEGSLFNFHIQSAQRAVEPGTLAPRDIAEENSGVLFGAGWHEVQRGRFGPYRWAGHDAVLIVQVPSGRRPILTLPMEPGPGVDNRPFTLTIHADDGDQVFRCRVDGRKLISVHLPKGGTPQRLTFHVDGGGRLTHDDARIMNFRVFAPLGWGRPDWSSRQRFGWKKIVDGLPFVGTGRSMSPGHASKIISPLPLHLGTAGDFTLMAREHWLAVRGYPELAVFPLHLDTLLCYAAHHAGARETVLAEPMRIYHIEHDSGTAWTGAGVSPLLERLEKQGIPYLEAGQVLRWATQMRRERRPMIFNKADWGLAKEELRETVR